MTGILPVILLCSRPLTGPLVLPVLPPHHHSFLLLLFLTALLQGVLNRLFWLQPVLSVKVTIILKCKSDYIIRG